MHESDPSGPPDFAMTTSGTARATALRVVSAGSAGPSAEDLDALMTAVARHQDRQAFASLFEHFGPRLKSWLIRTGSAPDSVDDLVQDTFVLLWRKAGQFDAEPHAVAAWLFTIARNLRVDRPVPPGPLAVARGPRRSPGRSGGRVTRSACRRRGSARASGRRSPQLAAISERWFNSSFYEDKSHSIIASEMSMPLGTVKTRLRAAAARLRQFWKSNAVIRHHPDDDLLLGHAGGAWPPGRLAPRDAPGALRDVPRCGAAVRSRSARPWWTMRLPPSLRPTP